MKNNKGISLVALIVMIIIMIILAGIATNIGIESYEKAMESKAETEREEVEKAITGRFGDYQRNSTANPLVGLFIPEEYLDTRDSATEYITNKLKNDYGKMKTEDEAQNSTQKNSIKKFVSDNFDDMEYTRILVNSDLLDLEIENTNLNAVYVVNYYSHDVVGPID